MLTADSFKYLGGLIVPHVKSLNVTPLVSAYPSAGQYADALNFGGKPFALDHRRREFILGTRYGRVARLQIVEPAPQTDNNPSTFPTMPYVTDTMVELSGVSKIVPPLAPDHSWWEMVDPYGLSGVAMGGFLPMSGDRIMVQGTVYYDANNIQTRSTFLTNWPPTGTAAEFVSNRTPFRTMQNPGEQGLIAGYGVEIPEAWRERLKGDVLTGQGSLPIITRGSAGPCVYSFKSEDVATLDPVPALMLVGYPSGHWMPGHSWDNPNADPVYNSGTMIQSVTIIGDHIVFCGSHGYGTPCYGNGTSDPALEGQPSGDGSHWCYDPAASAKGNHAYPYRIQCWVYPLEALADVAAGVIAPWDLVPDWFTFEVPFMRPDAAVNGCVFDPTTNRLYLSVYGADGYGYEPGPIIYAYEYLGEVNVPPIEPPTPGDEIERLQKTVIALTLALGAERQRHEATKASVHADAQVIADHAATILAATVPKPLR
jgi:hypothetical protein